MCFGIYVFSSCLLPLSLYPRFMVVLYLLMFAIWVVCVCVRPAPAVCTVLWISLRLCFCRGSRVFVILGSQTPAEGRSSIKIFSSLGPAVSFFSFFQSRTPLSLISSLSFLQLSFMSLLSLIAVKIQGRRWRRCTELAEESANKHHAVVELSRRLLLSWFS